MTEQNRLQKLFEEYFADRCPICQGSKWIMRDGLAERCSCFQAQMETHRLDFAGIPASYQHCTLEKFTPQNQAQRDAKAFLERFTLNFEMPELLGKGILFRGPVGVGKTHLAVSVLKRLIEKGFTGKFFNFVHLLEQIKQSFNPELEAEEPHLPRLLARCHVVVLDELGASRPTEFVFNKLYDIVNYCFDRKISVIFTTNYLDKPDLGRSIATEGPDGASPDGLRSVSGAAPSLHTLAERINPRLYSRIMEHCIDITLGGPDYRLRHKKKN